MKENRGPTASEHSPPKKKMGRWDPAKKRQNYARLRVQELRKVFPLLPEDALQRASSLRGLSTAVRRAGANQTVLTEKSTVRSRSSKRAGSTRQKGEQEDVPQSCLDDEPQQNCPDEILPASRARHDNNANNNNN